MTSDNHITDELDRLLTHAERLQSLLLRWRLVYRVLVIAIILLTLYVVFQFVALSQVQSIATSFRDAEMNVLANDAVSYAIVYLGVQLLLAIYLIAKANSLRQFLKDTKAQLASLEYTINVAFEEKGGRLRPLDLIWVERRIEQVSRLW